MTRSSIRRFASLALVALAVSPLAGCASPFSEHAKDVEEAWGRKWDSAHRKYDRYILGLDWDDPTHQWHDESYATGTMHH